MEDGRRRIKLDLDLDRIKEIVTESMRIIHEYLGGEFARTDEEILEQVMRVLSSGLVSTKVFVPLGSKKIPDLTLRVDPVRREVLCQSSLKRKAVELNYFLSTL